ncbi:MAG: class I SAM-dependent methyltransferase [Solirubrobacteraceae bacterium]|nr:class I SAM-dependent methyltransferase [Solirubrobacteraceae bacterium]
MWRIESALDDAGAPYDRKAAGYDRLVRSRTYNRLVWGTTPDDYEAFAAAAIAEDDGPLLDVAAGSAAATAELHARSGRPTVLVDRSIAMLERAAERIGDDGARVRLLQADALDLPLDGGFTTVLCMGFLHIVENPRALLDALLAQTAPGGAVHASSLVAETAVGRRYLGVLHRAGEVAAPRTVDELAALLGGVQLDVRGSMAYLTIGRAG